MLKNKPSFDPPGNEVGSGSGPGNAKSQKSGSGSGTHMPGTLGYPGILLPVHPLLATSCKLRERTPFKMAMIRAKISEEFVDYLDNN